MRRRLWPLLTLGVLAALLEACFLALHRFHPFDQNIVEVLVVLWLASLVYFIAAWFIFSLGESSRAAVVIVLLAALAFRATLFPLPATLSTDLDRYQWEGALQAAGQNPYLVAPEQRQGLPGPGWSTAYAPLTELLFWLAASVDGRAAFKFLSLLFDVGALLVLLGLLAARRQPPARALLYAWSPLVVVEFAASGHNDSLALFALLVALFLIIGQRTAVSIAALAAATMTKWFAAVAAPVFLRRGRWWGLPLFAAVAAATLLPYADAGASLFAGLRAYATHWRNNASLYELLLAATGQEVVAFGAAAGILLGLALHLARKDGDPLRACYLLLAALLLLSPSVFPWYVTWLVPFLCFFPHPAFLLWTATVLLNYHVLIDYTALGLWRYNPWLVALEYAPIYALLLLGRFGRLTARA
ncbi:MAG: hypothetical protein HYY26_05210 [Acidobacteria bacterium]|nr:hypothetical protein [Acidobacteriota bacterium]